MDSDDEHITLSAATMDALQEFYTERDARTEQFHKLQAEAEKAHYDSKASQPAVVGNGLLSMDAFAEDWNESQFWYSDETARLLASQLLEGCSKDSVIVVVSAPSVFVALKNLVIEQQKEKGAREEMPRMVLLEHDNRFAVFGNEFVFYDFNQPLKLPAELKGVADRIICDPPFLSEECQTRAAMTVRWLSGPNPQNNRVIICTGERMEELITTKLYKAMNVRTTDFEPMHARGLSNEFFCYADFECKEWKWK